MTTETFKVKLLHPNAKVPTRASSGSAGYDLYAVEDGEIHSGCDSLIPTGIAIQIPDGTYGRIASRSGLSVRNKIEVGAGVIDKDYSGEVKVHLYNFGHDDDHRERTFRYKAGDRIAQLILEKIVVPEPEVVEELDQTDRGLGGFGSTGK